jgi:fatty-acid desaturase
LIAQIALFISVWLAAYDFVRNKSRSWKIVYLVFLILSILGLVGLGLGSLV